MMSNKTFLIIVSHLSNRGHDNLAFILRLDAINDPIQSKYGNHCKMMQYDNDNKSHDKYPSQQSVIAVKTNAL